MQHVTVLQVQLLNNMPITLAQKYLGHNTKLSTTMDYYVKNGLMDVANINKGIDRLFA